MGSERRRSVKPSDEYGTPNWVWQPWHQSFNFVLDAAASNVNHLTCCTKWYTKEQDAFKQNWAHDSIGGAVWCNPPYGKAAGPLSTWIDKARSEATLGATVIMLLPSDTSTKWFHELYFNNCVRVEFVLGRVRFLGAPDPAKFGSIIVVMSPV